MSTNLKAALLKHHHGCVVDACSCEDKKKITPHFTTFEARQTIGSAEKLWRKVIDGEIQNGNRRRTIIDAKIQNGNRRRTIIHAKR